MSEDENQRLQTGNFFALYSVFTIICGCLSWMFSKLRILMFQIWYQVTAVIWFILAVTVIVLLIRLLRLNKLKMKLNIGRSEKIWTLHASFSVFSLLLQALCLPAEKDIFTYLSGKICRRKRKIKLKLSRFAVTSGSHCT